MTKATAKGNENLGNAFPYIVENYDEITRRKDKIVAELVKSKAIDSSITSILSNLMNFFERSQFSSLYKAC